MRFLTQRRDWNENGEGRSLAFTLALHGNAAAMELDDVPRNGEAQAEASVGSRRRAIGLLEALEDVGQKLGFDALPVVRHAESQGRIDALESEMNAATPRRELDGIAQEVPDHLLQSMRVAHDRTRVLVERSDHANALGVDGQP